MWMWRRRALKSLREDIRDHLARETESNIARGMTPDEARRQARLTFGNVVIAMEDSRQVWGRIWLDQLRQDLRYAFRTLLRNPAFAATAAATLALAIGANTAMFSVLNAVVLRPLPYQSPEHLAALWSEDPAQNLREGRSSLWNVNEWRHQSQSFADLAVFDSVSVNLTAPGGTERIVGGSASGNLLAILGVSPVLGRAFSTDEADQGRRPVLISDRFWQERFGRSADAIGATLVLNGAPSEIVGVLPEGFQIARVAGVDVWQPLRLADLSGGRPGGGNWFVIGRLHLGVTVDQAQAEMSAIARRLNDGLPPTDRRGVSVVPLSVYVVGPETRLALWMLGGAVFCVLLIAAANVTSLSLARSIDRAREMAVRAALGAGVTRIMRQVLVEGVVLAAVSGLTGALLAAGGIRLVRAFGPGNLPRLNEVSLDMRVLGWTMAISVLVGIVVGLAPAIATVRPNLRAAGEEGGRSVSGSVTSRRIRRALVVLECALAVVLLVGAGLLIRSWRNVTNVDPGFQPERVLALGISSPTSVAAAARADLYGRILERVQALPGVESAGIMGDLFIGNSRDQVITTDGSVTSEHALRFRRDEASQDVFRALGTPLLRGRFFSAGDGPGAPRVAVVNEFMARRLWPGRDPLGERLKLGARDSDGPWFTVVGVVGDMRRQGLEREPIPQMFDALAQNAPGSVDLFVRTSTDTPLALAGAVRAAVHDVEPDAPIYGVASLDAMLGGYLDQRRFETGLLTGFALTALLMAAVGIYGVLQYSIATRTKEIGLRMAIGAQPGDVFRMLVGEGVRLTGTGLVLGLVGALLAGQIGSRLLFGVTPLDPLTYVGVALLLFAVAGGACYFPARRAMKIGVTAALRQA